MLGDNHQLSNWTLGPLTRKEQTHDWYCKPGRKKVTCLSLYLLSSAVFIFHQGCFPFLTMEGHYRDLQLVKMQRLSGCPFPVGPSATEPLPNLRLMRQQRRSEVTGKATGPGQLPASVNCAWETAPMNSQQCECLLKTIPTETSTRMGKIPQGLTARIKGAIMTSEGERISSL